MKTLLVIDIPNNIDIPLEDIKADITVSSKDVRKSMLYLKYKNVELKPWNACLEEIIGDINEGLQRCMGETE